MVVPRQTVRRINLYDFFSVLLPGLTLILGIYPLLPQDLILTTLSIALSLLVIGFVAGRVIHTIATSVHKWLTKRDIPRFKSQTHRDLFIDEICNPNLIPVDIVELFHEECWKTFSEIGLRRDQRYTVEEDSDLLEGLYTAVRSYTHVNSQGPSENFQAIYAFYRNVGLVMVLLFAVYGFVVVNTVLSEVGWVALSKYVRASKLALISSQTLPLPLVIFFTFILTIFIAFVFRLGMRRYKTIYVQYIMTDFIAIQKSE